MCPRCFRLKVAEFDSLRPPRRLPGRFRERVWPVFWRLRPKNRCRIDSSKLGNRIDASAHAGPLCQ
jgi:hypothetical protein